MGGEERFYVLLQNLEQSYSLKEHPACPYSTRSDRGGAPHFAARESGKEGTGVGEDGRKLKTQKCLSLCELLWDSYFLPSAFLQLPNFLG